MSGISPEQMEKAELVLETILDEWIERPGVTAIDLGFKWSEGQMTGELAIRVHVAAKKDKSELTEEELFPEEIDGVLVDVIEATYAPQALVDAQPEAAVEGRGGRFDTIPIGVSVGCKYSTAGTLGAKVFDLESNEAMILSNWHVLAGRRDVEAGIPIWQPGWIDGGTREENTIAELTRWMLGPYDAAVARLTGAREVQTTTPGGRAVEDITKPRLGMLVWKSGRSTGYTEGFVDGVMMKIPLSYREAGVQMLEQVFRIVPRPGAGNVEISIGGDSGSVWVDEASGKAVGLHFAGESGDSPEHALAHSIDVIVEALKVRFPAQPAPEPPPTEPPPDRGDAGTTTTSGRGTSGSSFWDSIILFLRRLFGSK